MNQVDIVRAHPFKKQGVEYIHPEPLYAGVDVIGDFAEKIAKELNYPQKKDIISIIQYLGGEIYYLDYYELNQTASGSILVHGQNDFQMFLSKYTGKLRNNFTLAHELGHYFMHSVQGETPIYAERSTNSRLEQEADFFAGSFLMPKKKFLADYQQLKKITLLAQKYKVSDPAAYTRLKVLGALA